VHFGVTDMRLGIVDVRLAVADVRWRTWTLPGV
jgi:hypothetical protein